MYSELPSNENVSVSGRETIELP